MIIFLNWKIDRFKNNKKKKDGRSILKSKEFMMDNIKKAFFFNVLTLQWSNKIENFKIEED